MTLTIWILFSDRLFCSRLAALVGRAVPGSKVFLFSSVPDCLQKAGGRMPADLIFADPFADPAFWPFLQDLQSQGRTDLIILTKDGRPACLATALQKGAWDFLLLPVRGKRLFQSLDRYLAIRTGLSQRRLLTQASVDRCLALRAPIPAPSKAVDPGEEKLLSCLASLGPQGADAVTLSRLLDCSPGTARTKAEALVQKKMAGRRPGLSGKKGRPRTFYYLVNASWPV